MTISRWFVCKVLKLHVPEMGTCFSHNVGFEMWSYCIHCGDRSARVHVR